MFSCGGLATLLEGAGCVLNIKVNLKLFYLIFLVLSCCVVEKNVFNRGVNTQGLGVRPLLGLPSMDYVHIYEKVNAIEYLKQFKKLKCKINLCAYVPKSLRNPLTLLHLVRLFLFILY